MLLDMGPLEVLTLFVIAVVVLGPEKLPKAISQTAAVIRKFRAFSETAQAEIRNELGPDYADLQLRDLHPKALAENVLLKAEKDMGLGDITASLAPTEPVEAPGTEHRPQGAGHTQNQDHHLSDGPRAQPAAGQRQPVQS